MFNGQIIPVTMEPEIGMIICKHKATFRNRSQSWLFNHLFPGKMAKKYMIGKVQVMSCSAEKRPFLLFT